MSTTYGAVISPVCIRIFPMDRPELQSTVKFVMDASHMDHLLGRFALTDRHKRKVLRALQNQPRVVLFDLDLEARVLSEYGSFAAEAHQPDASGSKGCAGVSNADVATLVRGHRAGPTEAQAWSRFYERLLRACVVLMTAYNRHALAAGHAEWHKQ